MARPLFSVVTVALNCADDAEATARSVLAQTYPDVEYLAKDGGSTDDTVARLEALGVRVVSGPDGGVYQAMNQALALCSGEYVCFMNAGDRFAGPGVLAAVAEAIERHGRPGLLYGDVRSLTGHPALGAPAGEGRLIVYPGRLSRFWLYRRMVCHQAWFVRRDVYGERPFDPSLRVMADYSLLLDMLLRRKVAYAHVPVEVAVFDGDGISTQQSRRRDEERQRCLRAFSPVERAAYRAGFEGLGWVARRVLYPLIYTHLPGRVRGRLGGL